MRSTARILFVFLYFSISCFIDAQITINGTVTDSELNPISNALVEIIDEADTSNGYSDVTDASGNFTISNITGIPSISTTPPKDHIILRNYPNPFNPSTVIYFELPKAEKIEIKIYDILGRVVRLLHSSYHMVGTYQIIWDGRNNFGAGVSAGIYFCRLKTDDQFKVHKMVLLDGGPKVASISSTTAKKSVFHKLPKTDSEFNFTIKVSGNSILASDFKYLTCSGDTTLNLMVPIILKTATIGPEGGILETEDFSLTIPEGAFSESVTLNLAIETDSVSFDDETFSKLFRIDGLPEFYFKDLPLKIKLQTNPTDSISFAVGSIDSISLLEMEFTNYDYYHAEDSSGYAVANISNPFTNNMGLLKSHSEYAITSSSNLKKLFVVLTSPGEVISSNGNFKFYYPKSKAYIIPDLDNYLEDAVEVVKLLGFNKLPLRSNIFKSNWPMKVTFGSLKNTPLHQSKVCASVLTIGKYEKNNNKDYLKEHWKITINSDIFSNISLSDLRRTLGRDVFGNFLSQYYLYDTKALLKYWLDMTFIFWAEELFPKDDNHIPFIYEFFNKQPKDIWDFNVVKEMCNGLELSESNRLDKTAATNHRVVLIGLIEFLTKTNGDKIIVDIYNSIISQKSSVGGLIKALNDTENIWWPNFFKEFLIGNIYNVPSDKILKNITEIIEFNTGDTHKYVDATYNDLSAKLFRININSEEIENNKTLNFKINPSGINLDYVKTLVFGLLDGKLKYITEGIDFNIGNLSNYEALIACVVNSGNEPPYTGSSNISLEIKIGNQNLTNTFKKCQLSVRMDGKYSSDEGPLDLIFFGGFESLKDVGVYGDFFTASWDSSRTYIDEFEKEHHWSRSVYLSGNLDLENKTITNIYFEYSDFVYSQDFLRQDCSHSIRVIDYPIPKTSEGSDWFHCEILGLEIDLSKVIIYDKSFFHSYMYGYDEWLKFDLSKESEDNKIKMTFYY